MQGNNHLKVTGKLFLAKLEVEGINLCSILCIHHVQKDILRVFRVPTALRCQKLSGVPRLRRLRLRHRRRRHGRELLAQARQRPAEQRHQQAQDLGTSLLLQQLKIKRGLHSSTSLTSRRKKNGKNIAFLNINRSLHTLTAVKAFFPFGPLFFRAKSYQ